MNNIAKALVEAQKKLRNARYDSTNPHFRSKYASLEAYLDMVRPVMAENSLAVYQTVKDSTLETHLVHSSGETITTYCPLIVQKNDMQGLGSAITYARRYSIAALFSIGADDDDGNGSLSEVYQSSPHKNNNHIGLKKDVGIEYFSNYVCSLQTHKGKKLKDIPLDDLKKFYDLVDSEKDKHPDRKREISEFLEHAKTYIRLKIDSMS